MSIQGKCQIFGNRSGSIRNPAFFALVALVSGWAGHWLDQVSGSSESEGPGQLLWIVLPVLSGLLLRGFGDDGWRSPGLKPCIAGNGRWYIFALLCSPVCTLFLVFTGQAAGIMQVDLSESTTLIPLVFLALLPSLIKNIFEEFAWRGYLTPRLSEAGVPDALNHLLTGLVWAAWHVPYYLFFLDRATFAVIAPHGLPLFFAMLVAGVVSLAFVYGELRLVTGSVWPVVVLHTVSNALTGTLLRNGVFLMAPMAGLLVSPLPGSVVSVALNMAIWRWLHRFRRSGSPQ